MDKNFSLKIIIFIKTKNRKVLQKAKAVSVRKFGGEITARSKSIYNYLKTKLQHFTHQKLQTVITKLIPSFPVVSMDLILGSV